MMCVFKECNVLPPITNVLQYLQKLYKPTLNLCMFLVKLEKEAGENIWAADQTHISCHGNKRNTEN